MKGIVFNEFLKLVEAKFGDLVVDQMIETASPASGAAYTSAGYYDHKELVSLVVVLSQKTGIPAADLVRTFGQYLFGQLVSLPTIDQRSFQSTFDLLSQVDQVIHNEVRRLYPDAELPKLDCQKGADGSLVVTYRSSRHLADLAHGMIEGCMGHFQQLGTIERLDLPNEDGKQVVQFTVTL